MTLKEAQSIAERFVNMNSDNITIAELKQALVRLANFYEDYKCLLTKEDPDHSDYIDPYLRDGENQNYN